MTTFSDVHMHTRIATPISPRTKAHNLAATRIFFRDCREWDWIPRRFDPSRALAVPPSVAALISTNTRVIADEVWAAAAVKPRQRRLARQLRRHPPPHGTDQGHHAELAV